MLKLEIKIYVARLKIILYFRNNYLFNKMISGKKIIVVMPAYNAEKTLETTFREIPFALVDDVIVVDDASNDNTSEIAKKIDSTGQATKRQRRFTIAPISEKEREKIIGL